MKNDAVYAQHMSYSDQIIFHIKATERTKIDLLFSRTYYIYKSMAHAFQKQNKAVSIRLSKNSTEFEFVLCGALLVSRSSWRMTAASDASACSVVHCHD